MLCFLSQNAIQIGIVHFLLIKLSILERCNSIDSFIQFENMFKLKRGPVNIKMLQEHIILIVNGSNKSSKLLILQNIISLPCYIDFRNIMCHTQIVNLPV